MARATRVGVDVGGTFTDLVSIADGMIVTAKVPSVPTDQSLGVLAALKAAGAAAGEVASVAHGTTVATNALLERQGARTALVTTHGFRDVIEIARQDRHSLYDLAASAPAPLVPRDLRFTVRERIGPEGVREPLDEASLAEAVEGLAAAAVDAVAVCLLFSFADPAHEQRIRDAVAAALPAAFVVASSDVLPEFREYERFATTTAGAYLGPGLSSYLERLRRRLEEAGLPRPIVMQSSGGVVDVDVAAAQPSTCVLSGPAAGVVASGYAGGESGFRDLLTFDMGGTSTDVGLVLDGVVQTTTGSVVSGIPIGHPMVDVHTVSAGGGSLAWVDSGGALRVGPRSAGALPGPACYDRGGTEATVTDADLLLGYLADGARLGREVVLSRTRAQAAVAELAAQLGVDVEDAALGVARVAEAEMTRALRVLTVERGIDPRGLTLLAFGGAGGMHACRLAEELEIGRILVPRAAGVLSALGLAVADVRRDYARAFFWRLDELPADELEATFARLEDRARGEVDQPRLERFADLRYHGQSFELTVRADGSLAEAFHAAHERRYGYRVDDTPVEVVALRLTATSPVPKPRLGGREEVTAAPSSRQACFDGVWRDTAVRDANGLEGGERVEGPAVLVFPEATCVLRPGWAAARDAAGALVLERV